MGKTYGEIAIEDGKLEEFQVARLEIMKDNPVSSVANGALTQEQAD